METKYLNQQLFSYAYLSVAFDKSHNIFKNYVLLVEYFFHERKIENNCIAFEILNNGINELFGIQMPKATLQTILRVMQKDESIKIEGNNINVYPLKGKAAYIDNRNKIESDIAVLISNFSQFMHDKGVNITDEESKDVFYKFLKSNSFVVVDLYQSRNLDIDSVMGKYSDLIIEFLNEIKINEKILYDTVLKLTIGAIRTSILNLRPDKISEFDNNKKFSVEKIIIDTNFLLRILGLQGRLDCKIAKETFNLLKKLGVEVLVHEKTIDEMIYSISNYLFLTDTVQPSTKLFLKRNNVQTSGFLAAENNGVTRSNLLKYRDKEYVVERIADLECKIVNENVNINEEEISLLVKEKNRITYDENNARHDLILIEYCQLLRKNKKHSVTDSKVWVLTNDVKLTNWNKSRCKYFNYSCITESEMASYTWLMIGNEEFNLNYTIQALVSQNSMDIAQVIDFQKVYLKYATDNNAQGIEQLALLFACGDVTKEEILDLHDNESIDSLIATKISDIEEENKSAKQQMSEQIEKMHDELQKAKSNVINTRKDLTSRLGELKKENEKLKQKNDVLQNSLGKLQECQKLLVKTGRYIGIALFMALCVVFVASIFIFIEYKILEKLSFQIICSLLVSLIVPISSYVIGILIVGKPVGINQMFLKVRYKICHYKIEKFMMTCDDYNEDEINKNIQEIKGKMNGNNEAMRQNKNEIEKIEYALERITQLE